MRQKDYCKFQDSQSYKARPVSKKENEKSLLNTPRKVKKTCLASQLWKPPMRPSFPSVHCNSSHSIWQSYNAYYSYFPFSFPRRTIWMKLPLISIMNHIPTKEQLLFEKVKLENQRGFGFPNWWQSTKTAT